MSATSGQKRTHKEAETTDSANPPPPPSSNSTTAPNKIADINPPPSKRPKPNPKPPQNTSNQEDNETKEKEDTSSTHHHNPAIFTPKPQCEAIIFDMDGLMIDSEPLWHISEIECFKKVGITLNKADCESTIGIRIGDIVSMRYNQQPWDEKLRTCAFPPFFL